MEYVSVTGSQVLIFLIYGIIGLIAVRTRVLDTSGLDTLSRFITKIALPLLVFTNTISGTTREQLLGATPVVLAAAILYPILYVLGLALAELFHLSGNRRNLYRAALMFGNIGFIGLPIITALLSGSDLLYASLLMMIDQTLLWTIGYHLTSSVEEMRRASLLQRLRHLANPAMIGIVLALLCILLRIQMPKLVNAALTKTGSTATPLAMIYLGGTFAHLNIRHELGRVELYAGIVIKMLLLPIALYAVLSRIPVISQPLALTAAMICAMPSMSAVAMLAQAQGSDTDYAAGIVFLTTICSIVTLPLVCSML